jgi:hypothetical protein
MIPAVLCAGCFSESSSESGRATDGPWTAGSETSGATSTQDGADAAADATTTSTTLATTGGSMSAGSTTGGDTADSTSDSADPCPELLETFEMCPGAPWVASDPDLVECIDGEAVLTVTSVVDGNVTLMLPVGLAGATAVVELGDLPPPGIVKVLRVRTPDAQVIAYRSNGTTSALEVVVASGDSQELLASTPHDAEAHRWVRLREDDGWLYFETSADGVMFAAFHVALTPFDLSDTTVGIAAGNVEEFGENTSVSFGQFEYCTASRT